MKTTTSVLAEMLRMLPGVFLLALILGGPLMTLSNGHSGAQSLPKGGAGFVILVSLQRAG